MEEVGEGGKSHEGGRGIEEERGEGGVEVVWRREWGNDKVMEKMRVEGENRGSEKYRRGEGRRYRWRLLGRWDRIVERSGKNEEE